MRIVNSEFKISATNPKQYPQDDLKEIVLVGKSNVGKSSFINTLANRKNLARTSSVPGKTRLINYYKMISKISVDGTEENKDFYFVDLPGYGFSQMSKQEQITVGNFIEEYLSKSKKISLIVFLIDIRHDPTNNDKLMYDYIIKQNIPCVVVCNKADKLAPTKVDPQVTHLQEILNPLHDLEFTPFSCEKKIYNENILKTIEKAVLL